MNYGVGALISILVPFVLLFLGIVNILQTLFIVFLLLGVWTLVATFAMVERDERNYYASWGVMLVAVSSFFVIQIGYAIALVIVAVIAAVLISFTKRNRQQPRENQQNKLDSQSDSLK